MNEPKKKEFKKKVFNEGIKERLKPKLPLIGLVITVLIALLLYGGVNTFFRDPWEFFGNILIPIIIIAVIVFPLLGVVAHFECVMDFMFKYYEIFSQKYNGHKRNEFFCDKSIEALPTNLICEKLDKKLNKNNKETKLIPEPEEVFLDTDKQYEFLENEMSEINMYINNRIINSSAISNIPELKETLNNPDNSISDIVNKCIKLSGRSLERKYDLSELDTTCNKFYFFKIIDNYCKENNIQTHSNEVSERFTKEFDLIIRNMLVQIAGSRKGYIGELRVNEHLALYKDILTNVPNVRLEAENTSVEADNIVVTDKGIFCIETKNYGSASETLSISRDGQWKRFKGENEIPIKNIADQHNRHIGIMQRLINDELKKLGFNIPYIKFESLYVIANDDINIDNKSSLIVIRPSNIYNEIDRFESTTTLPKNVQTAIVDIINKHKLKGKAYRILSYKKTFKAMFDNLITTVEQRYSQCDIHDIYIDILEELGLEIVISETKGELGSRFIEIKHH